MRVQARLGLTKLRHGVGELLFLLRLGFLLRGQRLATFGHELQVLLLGLQLLNLGLLDGAHEVRFHHFKHPEDPSTLRLCTHVGLAVAETGIWGILWRARLCQGQVDLLLGGRLVELVEEIDAQVEGIQALLGLRDGGPVLHLLGLALGHSLGLRILDLGELLAESVEVGRELIPLGLQLGHLGVQSRDLLRGIRPLLTSVLLGLVTPTLLAGLVGRLLQKLFDELLNELLDLREGVAFDLARQGGEQGAPQVQALVFEEVHDDLLAGILGLHPVPARVGEGHLAPQLQERGRLLGGLGVLLDGLHGTGIHGHGLGEAHRHA
mmetsp:Transcript_104580/g.337074  ORF Transcript_104580/g.337074 Transcript_104580/m.337074 type:complete len:322 (-) Transcript_104580:128-1093(-)